MSDQEHTSAGRRTASEAGSTGEAGLLLLDERDSVAVATRELVAGESLAVGRTRVDIREPIPFGHKVALVTIASGAPVAKYGEVIGVATADIAAGAHVHVHNVVSARLPGPAAQPR